MGGMVIRKSITLVAARLSVEILAIIHIQIGDWIHFWLKEDEEEAGWKVGRLFLMARLIETRGNGLLSVWDAIDVRLNDLGRGVVQSIQSRKEKKKRKAKKQRKKETTKKGFVIV
jgi:hypothetical protein